MNINILRESTVIVPTQFNDGTTGNAVLETIEELMVELYGGFTKTKGEGAFSMPDGEEKREPVTIYTIAVENTLSEEITLREIATWIAVALDQEAVYLKFPSGAVEFVGQSVATNDENAVDGPSS